MRGDIMAKQQVVKITTKKVKIGGSQQNVCKVCGSPLKK